MTRWIRLFVVALTVSLVALSGCQGATTVKPVEATLTLVGGKPEQVQRIQVQGGAKVTLTFVSDTKERVHVHGYDLEFDVEPGKSETRTFVANQLGSYEIETHTSNQIIAQLVVR